MGADIHYVVEKRANNGRWHGVFSSGENLTYREWKGQGEGRDHPLKLLKDRHYKFFANLAGVRGDGPEPNGIPADASDMAFSDINDVWGVDGHSHGHCSLERFAEIKIASGGDPWLSERQLKCPRNEEFTISRPGLEFFVNGHSRIVYEDEIDNLRVVFWFDS